MTMVLHESPVTRDLWPCSNVSDLPALGMCLCLGEPTSGYRFPLRIHLVGTKRSPWLPGLAGSHGSCITADQDSCRLSPSQMYRTDTAAFQGIRRNVRLCGFSRNQALCSEHPTMGTCVNTMHMNLYKTNSNMHCLLSQSSQPAPIVRYNC